MVYCRKYIYIPVIVKRNTKFSQDQLPIQGEKQQQDPDGMPLKTENIRVLVYRYNKIVCYQYDKVFKFQKKGDSQLAKVLKS